MWSTVSSSKYLMQCCILRDIVIGRWRCHVVLLLFIGVSVIDIRRWHSIRQCLRVQWRIVVAASCQKLSRRISVGKHWQLEYVLSSAKNSLLHSTIFFKYCRCLLSHLLQNSIGKHSNFFARPEILAISCVDTYRKIDNSSSAKTFESFPISIWRRCESTVS